MANNLSSNTTTKVARVFLDAAESSKVLCKTVNTSLFSGEFTPQFGDTIYVKRPTDYKAIRTADGDLSAQSTSPIISGRAACTVQNYITTWIDWTNKEEALQLDQLKEILEPAATRIITELETSLATFMYKNSGQTYGTPGTPVTTWEHVAGAGALSQALGIPMDGKMNYVMNPFTQMKLASAQSGIYSDGLVKSAWESAQIKANFGGMRALSSNALPVYTAGVSADRAGTLTAAPTATYVGAKDTMTQVLAVTGFSNGATVVPGDVIEVTGRYRLNMSTRQLVVDATGAPIKWRGTVTTGVTLGASGEGNITVTGPAIYEATGAYNTVDSALNTGDVVTILGTSGYTAAPNLCYHSQAFAMATVKLPKLHTWDTVATTKDGFSIRVTKYSDGTANTQKLRLDLLPAFGVMNPLYAMQAYAPA
jgi:hypothetical protein